MEKAESPACIFLVVSISATRLLQAVSGSSAQAYTLNNRLTSNPPLLMQTLPLLIHKQHLLPLPIRQLVLVTQT